MTLVRRDPAFDDPRQNAASTTNWNRMLSILDARLAATQAFVAGADFTLADIPIGLGQSLAHDTDAAAIVAGGGILLRTAERAARLS